MKKIPDLIANKVLEFPAKTVFTVYVRRSNCNKKVIYTGTDINKALNIFHSFKVFKKDYKYLMYSELGLEHIIYRNVGEGKRPPMQGKRERSNHLRKRMQIESIPLSLWQAFETKLTGLHDIKGKLITPSRVIPKLIAGFCVLEKEQCLDLINDLESEITKHIMLSGGDNTRAIKDYLTKEVEEELL